MSVRAVCTVSTVRALSILKIHCVEPFDIYIHTRIKSGVHTAHSKKCRMKFTEICWTLYELDTQ